MLMFKCFVKADLRQKNLMFWDWVFPFLLMLGASFFIGESQNGGYILGGLMAFLVMQTMIFGVPYRISEYIEQGLLQLISEEGSTAKFLFGFLLTRTTMAILQCVIFMPIGALIMKVDLSMNYLGVAIVLITSLIILGGIAIVIASACSKQQTAFGLSQLAYMLMAITSGIFYPLENSPQLLQAVSKFSPLTYISQQFGNAIAGKTTTFLPIMMLLGIGITIGSLGLSVINRKLNKRHLTIIHQES